MVIKLTRDSIRFSHDGKKLFDYDDIESITTVGSSAKKDEINVIGKILNFRHLMEKYDLGDELFRLVNVYLAESGLKEKWTPDLRQ